MANYEIKILKDKENKQFIPFVTTDSVFINGTSDTVSDELDNRYTKTETDNLITNKQDKLTAGTGISIINNVISSTAQGTITDVQVNDISVVTAGIAKVVVPTVVSDLTNDAGYIPDSNVIDDTSHDDTDKPLSANMGKELQDQINNLKSRGRFLALWDCETGLAMSDPTVNPYTYHTGDYFVIGNVGTTNYKPNGSTYDKDTPSTTVETAAVTTDDVYYYDGTVWRLQINTGKTVTFASISGQPTDNANLSAALNNKQNTLVSGTNIKTINGNSLLGSGNIDISGGGTTNAYWGGITGTLSNQTDLSDALASKQNNITSSNKLAYNLISGTPTKLSDFTNDEGFTTNTGTITGITMNGASKGTLGVVDLGTVITAHQDITGKQDKITASNKLAYSLISGTPTALSSFTNDIGATKKVTATITGDGTETAFTVQHNLNTRACSVTVYDATTYDEVIVNIQHTTTSAITITFAEAPTSTTSYAVVVIG